jgi:iron complex outermembrane receptor protein
MKKISIIIITLILVINSRAEDIKLHVSEPIIVSASRLPFPISYIGKTVSIITSEDIKQSKAFSLQEILNKFSSIDIQERCKNGIQADLSLRGSTFQQVLILIDGVKVNDIQTAHHNLDIPIPLELIDHIEIVHGSGSSIYGADAFGGIINIITKNNYNKTLSANFSYGQFNSYDTNLSLSSSSKSLSFISSSQINSSDGFTYGRDYKSLNFANKLSTNLFSGKLNFTAAFGFKNFGAYDFYTPGKNFPSYEKTKTLFLSSSFTKDLKNNLTFSHNLSYRHHYDNFILDRQNISRYQNITTNNIFSSNFSLSTNNAVVGFEIGSEKLNSTKMNEHYAIKAALFSEYNKFLFKNLFLNLSTRIDWHKIYKWFFSPSFSTSYILSDNNNIKLSISRAFRAPSYTELYYADPVNVGNPNLRPETALSYELAFNSRIFKNSSFSFAIFRRSEKNVIDWVKNSSDGKWYAENINKISLNGIESIFDIKIKSIFLSFSNTLISANQQNDLLNLKYGLKFPKLHSALTLTYIKDNLFSTNIKFTLKDRSNQNSYFLTDVNINFYIKSITIYLKCYNVFDTSYQDIVGIAMPGRWIFAGVSLNQLF